ncbi:hypothetical protein Dacet_2740 [Denitrovibrio acetiphilus DSM 12809]|uniref:Uncharacterized protein n=1 Tax=Denitrovibrio acetiphilus (strain DSM 12809 / NBRC 114555 / N2460) TaxID=522772 RepID=D4H5Q3_DENA2|nr:hypothetical protein [Denitrovibrio acetiphilus]ADD69494.1 hypothetical protein Dacet_2740 [Denitrovibrio acetiphilus DSM 12809]
MNPKKIQIIGLVLVLAFFGMIVARALMQKDRVVKNEDDFKATQGVLEETWQLRHIGETGLVVITPDSMKHVPTKLDDEAKKTLISYDAFEYSLESFGMRINHIVSKVPVDSEEYADNLAKVIKKIKGVNKYTYAISPLTKSGQEGSFLKGTATQYGLSIETDSVILVKDNTLWEVTVSFNSDNVKLRNLAEKIFNSVEIR